MGYLNPTGLNYYLQKLRTIFAPINVTHRMDIKDKISNIANGVSINEAYLKNGVVYICGVSAPISTPASSSTLFSMADGFVPPTVVSNSVSPATDSDFGHGVITILPSGNANIIYSKVTTYGLYFSISYIL